MSASIAVFYLLNNDAATTGAVGGRIFPDVAPQTFNRPAIVIQTISTIPNNTLGLDGDSKLDICRVQITIASDSRNQSNNIAVLVRNVLKNVYNVNADGVLVNWCRFDSQAEYFDNYSSDTGLYITATDYKLSIINT
jgi:hypothetical protein